MEMCVHMTTTAWVDGPVGRVVEVFNYVNYLTRLNRTKVKSSVLLMIPLHMDLCPVYVYLMS